VKKPEKVVQAGLGNSLAEFEVPSHMLGMLGYLGG
jgi:hypothetical protein